MTEYTPTDEQMQADWHAYITTPDEENYYYDALSSEEADARWSRWLAAHDARVRRDAAREVGQYIKRLHPNGLTAKKSVLADIDIAADRMGRGIHANGRDRETP